MSDALTVSDQERETRRAGAVYPTPSPAPRPQRLQRSETLSEAEKRVSDPAMAADAASPPEVTGQTPGTHSAEVNAEPEPEVQAGVGTSHEGGPDSHLQVEDLSRPLPVSDSGTAGDSGRHVAGTASDRSESTGHTASRKAAETALGALEKGSGWIVGNADARDMIRRLQNLGQHGRYESAVFDCIDAAGFDPVVEMNKTPEGLEDDAPSGKIITELTGDEDGIGLSTAVEVKLDRSGGGLGLSLRESLIIEDRQPGPLRRSARLRGPIQRLELSAVGIQRDEISEEDFEQELHHALESTVSDLSASVLEDISRDDTYRTAGEDSGGTGGSSSSTSSTSASPSENGKYDGLLVDSASSSAMELTSSTTELTSLRLAVRKAQDGLRPCIGIRDQDSGLEQAHDAKSESTGRVLEHAVPAESLESKYEFGGGDGGNVQSSRDSSEDSLDPDYDLFMALSPKTSHSSAEVLEPPGRVDEHATHSDLTVHVQIKIGPGDDDGDMGEIIGDWCGEDVPSTMTLVEIETRLYSDCGCLQRLENQRFSTSSGFRMMRWREDNYWFERGEGREDPHRPVGFYEHDFMGSPSGEVRLCYKLVPINIRSTSTDRAANKDAVNKEASLHLRRLVGTENCFGGKEQAGPAGSSGEDAGNCPETVSAGDSTVSGSGLREMSSAASVARSTTSKLEHQCAEVVDRIDSCGWIDKVDETRAEAEDLSRRLHRSLEESGLAKSQSEKKADYERRLAIEMDKIYLEFDGISPDKARLHAKRALREQAEGVQSPSTGHPDGREVSLTLKPGWSVSPVYSTESSAQDERSPRTDSFTPVPGRLQPGREPNRRSPTYTEGMVTDDSSSSDDEQECSSKITVTVLPVVHKLEQSGRAREHAVLYDCPDVDMSHAESTRKFNAVLADKDLAAVDFILDGETIDDQGTSWTIALMDKGAGKVSCNFLQFEYNAPAGLELRHSMWTPLVEEAVSFLHLFGLSKVKMPESLFAADDGSTSTSHDEVHVVEFYKPGEIFNPGGGSFHVHLGVSLSNESLKTLKTPFVDISGSLKDLCFVPYRTLNGQRAMALGVRHNHFWTRMPIVERTVSALREFRYTCRSNTIAVAGDSTRSSLGSTITVAGNGDLDPTATKQMKIKEYMEYVKKLINQHGNEALFTGDSNEDRTVWRALLTDIFKGPMPLGLPKYCLIEIVMTSLADGKGHEKKEPKKWLQEYLTKYHQRAIRMGKDPELSLNGSMAAEKRVDVLTDLIDALEKSFPVTDLTDAMIRGLKKLELKYLSDWDEHFESIYNYLGKIYEAEVADPYYSKRPGYFEEHDLARVVMGHFGKISAIMDKHLKLAKEAQGYQVDTVFTEVWRVLSANGVRSRGGVFDAVVQTKFRQIDEFRYVNHENEEVVESVPGQFKWEVTPGRWLLQVIYDFLKAPTAHLVNEKEKTWYDFLHRCRTVKEGVEWLKSTDVKKSDEGSGKKSKGKKKKSGTDDSTDMAGLSDLSAEDRSVVDAGKKQYELRKDRLTKELNKDQGGYRFYFYKNGKWHAKCSNSDKTFIKKKEGKGCCLCGSEDHNMFTTDSDGKQVCKKHHLIINSWKRDPQADSEKKGRSDLDRTSQETGAEVGGLEENDVDDQSGGGKKKKTKTKKEPLPMEQCSVPINALDSDGNLSDRSKGQKCKVPGFKDKMVGEVVLTGEGTAFLCGLESSKKAPTQRQVNALSKERNIKLVFDPDVRLDSDEPGYKNGHFRIESAEVFQ